MDEEGQEITDDDLETVIRGLAHVADGMKAERVEAEVREYCERMGTDAEGPYHRICKGVCEHPDCRVANAVLAMMDETTDEGDEAMATFRSNQIAAAHAAIRPEGKG